MSSSHQKPDLEESINVAREHGRLVREAAAASREKRILTEGREPSSLWLIVTCGLALLGAGMMLGAGGSWFSYSTFIKPRYLRGKPLGGDEQGAQPKEALAAYIAKGQKLYSAKCNGCHGADGKGDGANYPSLAGSAWVTGAETERFAMVILNGLHGPTSTGRAYPGAGMPAQGAGMDPQGLAGLMTYLRNSFGNSTGDMVTAEMAKAAIEISNKRTKKGEQVTSSELDSDHKKALPGEKLDPTTMVDPVSLEPASAP
ncbi:MAG: cytochrome c [Verrucomicrobiota bacterium]